MKKLILLMLAIVLCFSICACGKSAEVKAVEDAIKAIGTEISIASEAPITTAEEMFNALSAEDQAKVENIGDLHTARTQFDAVMAEFCIPGTQILLPEFALADIPNQGAWIVDDRDDFTAYNFWPMTESDAERGFAQYMSYIGQNVEITEVSDEEFSFVREDGVVISVLAHFYSNACTIQVRVPKI